MRLVALCLTVLVAAGCGGSSTLSEKTLQKQTETVQSAAAEGALLASDVASDRTTEPFTRVHAEKLAEQAKKAAESLSKARPAAGLEDARRQALRRAVDVEHALELLHSQPANRGLARRLERELEELAG
jgi:molybdopterin biosynthesis enzyme